MTGPPRDTDKIFEDFQGIFGEFFGGKTPKGRGGDLSMPLRLSLLDAVHGCTREVDVARTRGCPTCSGTGGAPGASFSTCGACGGLGQTKTAQGAFQFSRPCEACRGARGRWSRACELCDGAGPSRVKVTVPPSVRPDQRLRLKGLGNPPRESATKDGEKPPEPGDLFLTIAIDLPKGLSIEGDHLVARVRLDADKASRGGTITVPWIDGSARVVVPPRTAHDARLVKRGWGLAPLNTPFSPPPEEGAPYRSADGGVRGDLVVIVSLGGDPDAILEAELAALPARSADRGVSSLGTPEVRAAAIGLAIVAAVLSYLLLGR